ncbi:MAG: bacteriohopanetetrol glucosamine biosynthesis glycosyltransferase HpnI [Hyphomicrobiales bacterium]|nr:bacteriohopanetetrol glucosamine biosynthesis glycosyltransferase HpnI [Hyphomicrobiales bacterium]
MRRRGQGASRTRRARRGRARRVAGGGGFRRAAPQLNGAPRRIDGRAGLNTIAHLTLALAALSAILTLVAAALAAPWIAAARAPARGPRRLPRVTVLKPRCGDAPGLDARLEAALAQDYPARVDLVLGVADPNDGALPAARRLVAAHPDRDVRIVVDPRLAGPNRKASNLANMEREIDGEIVVAADSDVTWPRDCLGRLVAALEAPGVGIVSAPYRGVAEGGPWARLAAMTIDRLVLPFTVAAVRLGVAEPCLGATVALRRDALRALGGFARFADRLADDHALGEAARTMGLRTAMPRMLVAHHCAPRGARGLARQELRWARPVRKVAPLHYAMALLAQPLPLALLALPLDGFERAAWMVVGVALGARFALQLAVDAALGGRPLPDPLLPLRDLATFAVFLAALRPGPIAWRGETFRVDAEGRLLSGEPAE